MSSKDMWMGGKRIGPLSLRPIFQERIWGVERLPDWYPQPVEGKPVGEAWLTAATCVVEAGPLAGRSVAELTGENPEAFGGSAAGGFPLLIKTLFPREKLSVQVHPNDVQAQALGEMHGKTECWYVLSAEAGATLALGFREELSLEQVREAIADATLEDKLRYLPVKAGDMVFVDAGTVHAIGPGMVVLETQQYSDITYRLYDYGRPRELHVDAGLAVSRTTTQAGLVEPVVMDGFVRLVGCEYFFVDRFAATERTVPLGMSDRMQLLFALGEGAAVESAEGVTPLQAGRIVMLPAEGVAYALRAKCEVVRVAQP